MGGGLDDRLAALGRVAGLEDAGADEHAVHTQLHHQRRVRRSCQAACREIDHRQTPQFLGLFD